MDSEPSTLASLASDLITRFKALLAAFNSAPTQVHDKSPESTKNMAEEGIADILAQSYKVQYQTAYHLNREGYTSRATSLLQDLLMRPLITLYRHSITKILLALNHIDQVTRVDEDEPDFVLYWTLREKIRPLWDPLADLKDGENTDDLIEWAGSLMKWLEWAVEVDLNLFGEGGREELEGGKSAKEGDGEEEVDILASMMCGMRVVARPKV